MVDAAVRAAPIPHIPARYVKPVFVLTILTGSFLLFLVQPMIARMALPRLGGAPAVWNSAMLVYQALLLGGYAYAHKLSVFRRKTQSGVHVALLLAAMLWLPVGLWAIQPPQGEAVFLWVLWLLLASIGPLFFAISAQAPLMQRWYAMVESDKEPYALYAASNFGSFAGLISYPLLVEPYLAIETQRVLWSLLYVVLVLLVCGCCYIILRSDGRADAEVSREDTVSARPSLKTCLGWVLIAFVPSGMMLSTTTHLTTDLIAMPLLWVIPLGLYLLSFTIAFSNWRLPADWITNAAPLVILICAPAAFMIVATGSMIPVFANLLMMFVAAIALHTKMYRTRPAPTHLTLFYLMMSVGGVLGGIFCALVAPMVFDWTYEHPVLVVLAALLVPQFEVSRPRFLAVLRDKIGNTGFLVLAAIAFFLSIYIFRTWGYAYETWGYLVLAVIFLICLFCIGRRVAFAIAVLSLMLGYGGWMNFEKSLEGSRTRSYFGVYTVTDYPSEGVRRLSHGTTLHGLQFFDVERAIRPSSYYGDRSGVGLALTQAQELFGEQATIGIVGLGTGTLGCYKQPGQSWHFFEIDPAMAKIAQNPKLFTYLSNCTPDAPIHIGDARLTLADQPRGSYDMVVIDAFSSDAIPMHLLTHEAFDVYDRAMVQDGLLIVHISNRYIDLLPVLASEAERRGWSAALRYDNPDVARRNDGEKPSSWVAFAATPQRLAQLTGTLRNASNMRASNRETGRYLWDPVKTKEGFDGWSDDYGSVLPLLKIWEK